MKLLVAGGAGYVGSHCVKRLCECGHEVVVFDNLSQGHRTAVPAHVELIEGDIRDLEALSQAFGGHAFDGAMHFAALLNVNESLSKPRLYYEVNVVGALNLISTMADHGVKRLVFSSTCATYGTPPAMPITEDMPKAPITPYGASKWMVERFLQDTAAVDQLGSVALRYFNASGAAADGSIGEDHDPEIHLIPLVLQVALGQREHISIFGTDYPTFDGTAVRDYIHVDDLAEAHRLAIEQVQPGEARAYNVGTGHGTSVRQVIEAVRQVTGHAIPAIETERRPGDPAELYANSSLIRKQLGWSPQYTRIDDVVRTAWAWHHAHPNGYSD